MGVAPRPVSRPGVVLVVPSGLLGLRFLGRIDVEAFPTLESQSRYGITQDLTVPNEKLSIQLLLRGDYVFVTETHPLQRSDDLVVAGRDFVCPVAIAPSDNSLGELFRLGAVCRELCTMGLGEHRDALAKRVFLCLQRPHLGGVLVLDSLEARVEPRLENPEPSPNAEVRPQRRVELIASLWNAASRRLSPWLCQRVTPLIEKRTPGFSSYVNYISLPCYLQPLTVYTGR